MSESTTRILVVEDEALIGMEIADRLAALGYHVHGVVRSGEEAVERAVARPPDLVLINDN